MKAIIADTSCLIIYEKINRLEILHHTFDELIVTDEVAEEFGELPDWIAVCQIANKKRVIKSVKEILDLIDKTNYRISESIKEKVLKKAGE